MRRVSTAFCLTPRAPRADSSRCPPGRRRRDVPRARALQRFVTQYAASVTAGQDQLRRLTDRERDLLLHMAQGRSNAEIAQELYVSEGTVKTHVAAILHKLALRDRGAEAGLSSRCTAWSADHAAGVRLWS